MENVATWRALGWYYKDLNARSHRLRRDWESAAAASMHNWKFKLQLNVTRSTAKRILVN